MANMWTYREEPQGQILACVHVKLEKDYVSKKSKNLQSRLSLIKIVFHRFLLVPWLSGKLTRY